MAPLYPGTHKCSGGKGRILALQFLARNEPGLKPGPVLMSKQLFAEENAGGVQKRLHAR